jgi:hypothetical protein
MLYMALITAVLLILYFDSKIISLKSNKIYCFLVFVFIFACSKFL